MTKHSENVYVVYITCPSEDSALTLAKHVVAHACAACVSIIPKIRSIYQWEGEICDDEEYLLLVKTAQSAYAALESAVLKLHPYDVPEIIAVPVTAGSDAYLQWVKEIVAQPS